MAVQTPDPRKGVILTEKGRPVVKYIGHSTVICAKTAEPIEMPFGLWTRVGPRKYVLDGAQIPRGQRQF